MIAKVTNLRRVTLHFNHLGAKIGSLTHYTRAFFFMKSKMLNVHLGKIIHYGR